MIKKNKFLPDAAKLFGVIIVVCGPSNGDIIVSLKLLLLEISGGSITCVEEKEEEEEDGIDFNNVEPKTPRDGDSNCFTVS